LKRTNHSVVSLVRLSFEVQNILIRFEPLNKRYQTGGIIFVTESLNKAMKKSFF